MKAYLFPAIAAFATLAAAGPLAAQGTMRPAPTSNFPANLVKEAKVSADSARTIARAQLPKAYIQSEELERENGRLIYSFDMKTDGKSGIDEVNVNALTGKLVGKVSHEGAKSEAREAATEKTEAKVKAKP